MNFACKNDIELIHIKDALPEVIDQIIGEHCEYDLVAPLLLQIIKE